MTADITLQKATSNDAHEIAVMVGELLHEIMNRIGIEAFNFNLDETSQRLREFITRENYFVFVARGVDAVPMGFIALTECYALYAEGAFGIIPELFVRPEFRSHNIGHRLVEQAKAFGISRAWKRLEVTTPPLPQFDKTLDFYEREGFSITGGRKLKVTL